MTPPGQVLTADDMADVVGRFFQASPLARRWSLEESIDWTSIDPARLTVGQSSAVQFITLIEDHLPGYFALYNDYFPVDDTVDRETFIHNRELYHFSVRWAEEEDTHARVLARYQTAADISDEHTLREALAVEGQKKFQLPYTHPVQYFAYALVQEKATQIYYQQLRDVCEEPVIRDILTKLSRDEARHFTFMANVVERAIQCDGDAVVGPIRDVIAQFRMPLADTMRGYWRWALKIADTAAYDHTDAYEHLIRVIDRAVDAKSSKLDELTGFIASCRTV